MSTLDADNLRTIISECKGLLREDILEAMEAAAAEIDRLQEVIKRLHKERRDKRN